LKIKIEQIVIILFLTAVPFLVYFVASTKSQQTINGTVIDFGATADDTGIHSFLIVKLENNNTVQVRYQLASGKNIGKEVLIAERTTKFFHMKNYKIIKWY